MHPLLSRQAVIEAMILAILGGALLLCYATRDAVGWSSSFFAYVYGAVYAVVLPQLFLRRIQDYIWLRVLKHNGILESELHSDLRELATILGSVERSLYVAAIHAHFPEFIGVWLAIKVAGGWRGWSKGRQFKNFAPGRDGKVPGAQVFNAHLVGTGLSLLFAAAGAYSIYWLLSRQFLLAVTIGALLALLNGGLLLWARGQSNTRTH